MTDHKDLPHATRYPGYDVLRKRHTPSWDETTRRVVDARLAVRPEPTFLDGTAWRTLGALCRRVVPQPADRAPVPLAALVDARLQRNQGDGYRDARLPPARAAWQRGLAALDAEAQARYDLLFHQLDSGEQDALIGKMQKGELTHTAWRDMPPQLFFTDRVLHDICGAYYSHPASWSEIGFGGPASPRGYVRLVAGRRDPWEAVEAAPGDEDRARKENERVR
ncbi:gluconate 2-dehydrogenase subunit 3 family protein [Paraburkholderia strydomiana]|uniref:gluconate 2-dehydrogenase subunit 3 family protein n=1 Tax=Paraburkholderia strydomiana TaxID=1245417 RepID=UPI001BE691CA|nr:gluconate 2-dehydrogenase subunit 3 family protein [Paraburkholderia strydomiana]MBT2794688.1 gluconate 2-dehydrogenase subunit 3 family protein [Paraburkholderia strydomiana]